LVFAVVWVLWLASRQIKHAASTEESNFGSMSSGRSTSLNSPARTRGDASAPTPHYAFTRLGLWVAVNAGPTPLVQPGPQDTPSIMPPGQSASATPLPPSNAEQNAVESTPQEDQTSASFKASAEERALKELVLDYIRTVSSNDVSTQERFFAQRVNFFGEGVLSLPMVQASMERYCRQWPIRKWEPRGEPEFPKILHSTNPKLYEVLQPLTWTVANGSEHKQGSTTLYVRIRKNEKGVFRIIHVEKRDRHVQSQSNS
jgi:hypothetical protein